MDWAIVISLFHLVALVCAADVGENGTHVSCPEVAVIRGHITVTPRSSCILESYEASVNGTFDVVPGRWYGMIRYSCGFCTGRLISKFQGCDDCDDCLHNRAFKECNTSSKVAIIGALVGSLTGFMAVALAYCIIGLMSRCKLADRLGSQCAKLKDKHRVRKARKITNLLAHYTTDSSAGSSQEVIEAPCVEERRQPDRVYPTHQVQKELAGLIQQSNKGHTPEDGQEPGTSSSFVKAVLRPPSRRDLEPAPPKPKPRSSKQVLLALVLLMIVSPPGPTEACDETLYISSNNKICRDEVCTMEVHGFTTASAGQKICFISGGNEKLEVTLKSISVVRTYQKIYHTSSYGIETVQRINCYHAGKCIWDECAPLMHDESLENALMGKLEKKGLRNYPSMINSTGCIDTNIRCPDTNCWDVAHICNFVSWALYPKGDLWTVYKIVDEYKMAIFEIKLKGQKEVVTLSAVKPIATLPIRIQLVSFLSLDLNKDRFILESPYGDQHNVDASEARHPITNTIGDIQISLDKSNYIYPTINVICAAPACNLKCVTSPPAIDKFIGITSQTSKYTKTGKDIIEDTRVSGSASFLLDIGEFNSLTITKPECKFRVMSSYACTGCTSHARVVVEPHSIKSTGIVMIKSNCTLHTSYVVCQAEIQEIIVVGSPQCCRIEPAKMNSSFVVCLDYIFTGQLSPLDLIQSTGFIQDSDGNGFTKLFENFDFLQNLGMGLGVTVGAAILIRLLKLCVCGLTGWCVASRLKRATTH